MIAPAPGMFCTMISGLPGMCRPRYCARKRPQSSMAPPLELPTISRMVLPLKKSCAAAEAAADIAKTRKNKPARESLFIEPPLQGRARGQSRLNSEQRARVVAKNLSPQLGGKMARVLLDHPLRIRPGARRMRIVEAEHHSIFIENAADHFHTQRIVDEADPDVLLKIFAGQKLRQRHRPIAGEAPPVAAALIPDVEALDHAGNPGQAGFGHDELHARMAVEDPAENQPGDGLQKLNAGRLLGETRSDGDRRIGAAPVAGLQPGLFYQHGEMKSDR